MDFWHMLRSWFHALRLGTDSNVFNSALRGDLRSESFKEAARLQRERTDSRQPVVILLAVLFKLCIVLLCEWSLVKPSLQLFNVEGLSVLFGVPTQGELRSGTKD